ncbi:MAG: hypothetical protein AB1646_08495 [Thermodesulfobacteriota bacterium]
MALPVILGALGVMGGIAWSLYSPGFGRPAGEGGLRGAKTGEGAFDRTWSRIILEAAVKGLVGGACGVIAGRTMQWLLDWLGRSVA